MKLPLDGTRLPRLALIALAVAGAFAATGCGSDDSGGGGGKFNVTGKVDHFAGPTPLVVRLNATAKNADGDVIYRWRFDDGTSSTKTEVHPHLPEGRLLPGDPGRPRRERQQRPRDLPVRSLAAQAVERGPAHSAHEEGRAPGAEGPAGPHRRPPQGATRRAAPAGPASRSRASRPTAATAWPAPAARPLPARRPAGGRPCRTSREPCSPRP